MTTVTIEDESRRSGRERKGKQRHARFWSTMSSAILKFMQAIAIVGGAVYTINNYLSFQRDANRQSLETQRLNSQLAIIQRDTQEFQLKTQRDQAEMRSKDLAAAVEVQRAQLEGLKVQRDQAQHQLDYAKERWASPHTTITPTCLSVDPTGNATYQVKYTWTFTNISETSLKCYGYIIDCYTGVLDAATGPTDTAKPMSVPSYRWIPDLDRSNCAVQWKRIASWAVTGGSLDELTGNERALFESVPSISGGGVGTIAPSETATAEDVFCVKAKAGSYLCFVTSFCFVGPRAQRHYGAWHMLPLPSAPQQ